LAKPWQIFGKLTLWLSGSDFLAKATHFVGQQLPCNSDLQLQQRKIGIERDKEREGE